MTSRGIESSACSLLARNVRRCWVHKTIGSPLSVCAELKARPFYGVDYTPIQSCTAIRGRVYVRSATRWTTATHLWRQSPLHFAVTTDFSDCSRLSLLVGISPMPTRLVAVDFFRPRHQSVSANALYIRLVRPSVRSFVRSDRSCYHDIR